MKKSAFCKFLAFFVVFVLAIAPVFAKSVNFAVISDVHYNDGNAKGAKADAKKILKGAVQRMNEERPDFVVFLGDNIDRSKSPLLKGFLTAISPIKSPYYIVVGNHDSYKYSGMNREEFGKIVSDYNPNQKKYTPNYVFHPTSDIAAVVVDSVSPGMFGSHGYFTQETLSWLDETLKKYRNKKVIIFQHVPAFEPVPNERANIINEPEYQDVLKKHNNILMVVSGHYHYASIKQDEKGVYHFSVPALYEEPYYYGVMRIDYDKTPLCAPANFKINGAFKEAF